MLELHYRRNQKHVVKAQDATDDRGETDLMVVNGLQDRVKEAQRKLDLQDGAMLDLNEKMDDIKDRVRQRQSEIYEIKQNIE